MLDTSDSRLAQKNGKGGVDWRAVIKPQNQKNKRA